MSMQSLNSATVGLAVGKQTVSLTHVPKAQPLNSDERAVLVGKLVGKGMDKETAAKVSALATRTVHGWRTLTAHVSDGTVTLPDLDSLGIDFDAGTLADMVDADASRLSAGRSVTVVRTKSTPMPTSVKFTHSAFAVAADLAVSAATAERAEIRNGAPTGKLLIRHFGTFAHRFIRPNGSEYVVSGRIVPTDDGTAWTVTVTCRQP